MRPSYERLLGAIHRAHLAIGRRAKTSRDATRQRRSQSAGVLHFEHLEPRVVMSAAGLVPVGAQPTGPLSGKIVYTSAGHGWQWNTTLNRFATDRGDNNEIVEDFGNQDQLTFYADYLLRAGATVVPMRPVGRQINEFVLDNDSPGVTYSGSWSNSTASVYYDEDYGVSGGGNADAVSYRFASISASETATATYAPNIVQGGFYPVYTWVADSANRANQLYRVNHSGGATEIRVDHRLVGKGWVYLGTYHFEPGSAGNVQISNRSTSGTNVIADSIRFGNGMGDVRMGSGGVGTGSISGYPREDENSLLWLTRAIGQGNSAATVIGSGLSSNVSAPSRMAEHMNAAPFGQAVYIGFHSNAGGGRGAVGLIDTDQFTPNQAALALYTGRQINQDMQALNGQFEHNWSTRTTHTFSGGFGEIDEGATAEMDMTIIEVGFHDSVEDAQLMRDPKVRDQLGRSTYEATLEYFDNFGGLPTPVTTPSAPVNVRAASAASGEVTLNWSAGPTGVFGQAATSYRIYASSNGYGFDGGTLVAGGATATATLSGYDPALPYYFRVVAVNAGGESKGSEVLAVSPNGGVRSVLIVNGFDRNERTQNVRYPYPFTGDGLVDRVRPRGNNSFDYTVQVASAIHAHTPDIRVASTSNEAIVAGAVNLANFDAVFWILGEESTATETFSAAEQTNVSTYLAGGGKLFVSGAELAWDLDRPNAPAPAVNPTAADRTFLNGVLKSDYLADDAGTYNVVASAGSIFTGLSFSFDNGAQFYNVDTPDRITPLGGATAALNYNTGTGAAGVQYTDAASGSQLVVFGFPFETITTAANRTAVIGRIIDYFSLTELPTEIEVVLDNDDGAAVYSETGAWETSGIAGYNGLTFRFAGVASDSTAQWRFTAPFAGNAEVSVQYRASASRATSAVYEIDTGDGVETASADQTANGFTWGSLGTFYFQAGQRTITLNAQLSSGGSVVNADAVRVILTAGPPPANADFDADGDVDGADFLTWQRSLGGPGDLADGDANGDNLVDGEDLIVWQAQFGDPMQAPSALANAASFSVAGSEAALESSRVDAISLAQFDLSLRSLRESRPAVKAAIREERRADAIATLSASSRAEDAVDSVTQSPALSLLRRRLLGRELSASDERELFNEAFDRLQDWSWRDGPG